MPYFWKPALLVSLLCIGCAARPVKVKTSEVIPRPCIVRIGLLDDSTCKRDGKGHLTCDQILVVTKCSELAVEKLRE